MYCETIPGLHVHVRMINWRIKSDRSCAGPDNNILN